MGQIRIIFAGSFKPDNKVFSAMRNGHADAVAQAIEWLAAKKLPQATALDHRLHKQGDEPEHGFDRDGDK